MDFISRITVGKFVIYFMIMRMRFAYLEHTSTMSLQTNFLCLLITLCAFQLYIEAKPLDTTSATQCGYQSCNRVQEGALNVHVVSHSHDDVGWLKTVEQYYDGSNREAQYANVSEIISSVIDALQANPERRFIQVESFFFHRWWTQQNEETKQIVHKLVENGQFEFTGGAWSMNDEAAADFHSIIDQFTFGLKFLNDTFGTCGQPKIGWQIDPFGHSSEMASIFAQMGYDGLFFPRIDYRDKNNRLNDQKLEMIWQGSQSLADESNIFTSIMFNHYNAPEGFCFDVTCHDDDIITEEGQADYNYETKVKKYAKVITDAATHYKTNHLLVPMGGDFNYMDATKYFGNLDALIKGFTVFPQTFNKKPINIFYSTPSCYVKAVNEAINAENIELPKEEKDFFPYATDSQTFWTGYFSSRPTSKRFAKEALNFLQVHKQLATFTQATNESELFMMQNAVGIMQHHDAITGTEQQHVANDYARILHEAFLDSGSKINEHISKLLSKDASKPVQLNLNQCLLKNVSICTETSHTQFAVVLYNPASTPIKYPAKIPVDSLDLIITAANGENVKYQVVPSIAYVEGVSMKYELTFIADLPPMGMKVYHFKPADVVTFLLDAAVSEDRFKLGGERTSAILDQSTGLLESLRINNISAKIKQELMYYNSMQNSGRNSGAYVFRNDGDAVAINQDGAEVTTYKGDIFDEVHQVYSDWAKQVIRIYKDPELADHVEFDWLVGPIPIDNKQGKEVITRFTSDFETGADFYTDANGRDLVHRVREEKSEKISGNYFPVTSEIAISNGQERMAVLNDRPQGGSSVQSGQIELMVHRLTLRDDYWGVGEILNETENGVGLKVRGSHFLTLTHDEDQNVERYLANKIAFAPWMFFDKHLKLSTINSDITSEFIGLNEPLPESTRVLTLEPVAEEENTVLLRLENFLPSDIGETQTVNVKNLFAQFEILSLEEMNLAGNARKQDSQRLNWYNYASPSESTENSLDVTLKPMQIKTFIARVKYVN